MRNRTITSVGIVGVLTSVGLVVTAPVAQAGARDGRCEVGEFCLYYNGNHRGSVSDFTGSVANYGGAQPSCYEFKGAGAGRGLCVKNRAASAWNRTSGPVTVYYNSGYSGPSQTIGPGGRVNLNAKLRNENASHRLGRPSASNVLRSGQSLTLGRSLWSPNRKYRLHLQGDKNLVLRAPGGRANWQSRTKDLVSRDARLVMQRDGNLVLYAGGIARWSSGTQGNPNSVLTLQNDGNAVVYAPGGRALFATATAHYQAFNDAVGLIEGEMNRNAAKMVGISLAPQGGSFAARAYFWNQVRPGRPWDHKPILRRHLRLTTSDSFYLEVAGLSRTALFYDYFSNLHYGYVGTMGGISSRELIHASEVWGSGNPDRDDRVPVWAGINLARSKRAVDRQVITDLVHKSVGHLRSWNSPQVRDLSY